MGANAVPATAVNPKRARPTAGRIALVACAYLLIVVLAAVLPLAFKHNPFIKPTPELQAYRLALWLVWLPVLIESLRSRPANPIWWLIFAYVVSAQVWAFGYIRNSVVWSLTNLLSSLYVPIFIHLVLAFPSGHLRGAWDRVVVAFFYLDIAVFSVLLALFSQLPLDTCTANCYQNVFAVWPNDRIVDVLVVAGVVVPILAAPAILIRLWRHWRTGSWIERQALAPILVAVPIVVASVSLEFLGDRLGLAPVNAFYASALGPVPLFVPPVAFLVGVLRLRLTRTRIADLIVELGRGVPIGGLRDVLARTLGDPTLDLVFASPSGAGFVDLAGRRVTLPLPAEARSVTWLQRGDDLLGVLIHDPQLDAQDPGLVEAAGTAARLALENERLAAQVRAQLEEVRASRARIVEAGDVERRRVERDLHDGAQQRLVALAMRLQLARASTEGASTVLDEATSELQAAIGEVRDLARGLHPPILTEAGLAAAIDALAERAPLPVSVNIPTTRYRVATESAAYFVVAEALTNVARHAGASRAYVTATEADAMLVLVIRDDGRGGADPEAGSGLAGLRDRLAAAGGTLSIASPADHGTILTAVLPVE
jgi:signal transduction histidine kinase